MRGAAGADIRVFNLYNAHILRELKLAAVVKRFEHLGFGECRRHLIICGNGVICLTLYLGKLLGREKAVEVDGHKLRSHVEADI